MVPTSEGGSREKSWGPGSVCRQRDSGAGGCSQSQLLWPGQGSPSQAQALHFPTPSLGWESLGSSQDKSCWCNVVSGGPAKPSCQHLERSLILESDPSNLQPVSCLDPFYSKTSVSPAHPSFPPPPRAALRRRWVLRFTRPMASTLGLPEIPRCTLLQASQPPPASCGYGLMPSTKAGQTTALCCVTTCI